MARVIGPNGVETSVPDKVAKSLVGNGSRGYAYAPEKKAAEPVEASTPKAEPRKRSPRKAAPKSED